MIIVPDGNHDAHDCPVGLSSCTEAQKLAAADAFLSSTLGPIFATSDFKPGGDGIAFITFDECGGGTNDGCNASVYTALIGPQVTPHTVSTVPYKHENTLRTMLDSLGIKNYPGASATAADMSDFFSSNSSSKPTVSVLTPAGGTTVGSPVNFQAIATASAGHSIGGWWIYVDGVGVYSAGATSTINTNVPLAAGYHQVVVRAWDNTAAYGDKSFNLSVNSRPSMDIVSPAASSTVKSPLTIKAASAASSGRSITGWCVYLDGVNVYQAGTTKSISTSVNASSGKHTLVVRAWDSTDAYGDETVTVTVQ